jgi:hypothetical protein
MRRIVAPALLLDRCCGLRRARHSGRSGETEPDWSHLRLDPETMALGTLSSVENGYAVFIHKTCTESEIRPRYWLCLPRFLNKSRNPSDAEMTLPSGHRYCNVCHRETPVKPPSMNECAGCQILDLPHGADRVVCSYKLEVIL